MEQDSEPNSLIKIMKLGNAGHVDLLKEQFESKGFQREGYFGEGAEGHGIVLKNSRETTLARTAVRPPRNLLLELGKGMAI